MSQNFGGRRENDYRGGGGQHGGDRWSNEGRDRGYRDGPRAQGEDGFGGASRSGFSDRGYNNQGGSKFPGGFGGRQDRDDQGKRDVGGFSQQQRVSPRKDFNGYHQQQRSPRRDEFNEYHQQQRSHPQDERNGFHHQEHRAPPPRRDYEQRPPHQEDRDRGYRDNPRAQGVGGFGGPPRGGFSDRGYNNQGDPGLSGGFGGEQYRGNRGGFGREGDRGGFGREGDRGGFGREGDRGGFGREGGDRGGFGREGGDRGGFVREGGDRGGFMSKKFSEEAGPHNRGFSRDDDHRGDRGGFNRDGGDSRRGGFGSGARGGFSSGGGFSRGDSSGFSRGFDSKYLGGKYHDQDNGAAPKFGRGGTFEPEGGVWTRTFERSGGGESMGARAPRGWMPDEVEVEKLYAIDKQCVEDSIYDQDSEVTVDGSEIKDQFETWDNAPLDERLRKTCKEKCGYPRPRNIQSAFIPQVLQGYDVLGQAETGSGKTAAFALPILEKIIQKKRGEDKKEPHAPYALILSPTRELTEQLYQQLIKFASGCEIDIHRSYGQMARFTSVSQINEGCDILVGCIGRIRDLIMKNDVSMKNIQFFVLDECDRLLDPKDVGDIMEIAEKMPPPGKRQTLMLSATFSPSFDSVAKRLINERKCCTIKASNLNKKITHEFRQASGTFEKNKQMTEILKKEYDEARSKNQDMPRTLIFVSRKLKAQTTAAEICKFFADIQKDMAASICSDNDQEARHRIMKAISEGKSRVLVGTDLCERGLDINNLDVVINYDMPPVADRYTHRTGRTGRNKPGRAYSIVDPEDADGLRELTEIIRRVKNVEQEVPSWLEELANRRGGGSFGGSGMRPGGFHASGMSGNGSGGFNNEGLGFNTGGFKSGGFSSNGGFNKSSTREHSNENGGDSSRFGGGGFSSSRGGFASTSGGFSSASMQDDDDWGNDDEMVKKIDEVKIETKPESEIKGSSAVGFPAQPREESNLETTIKEDDW